MNRDLPIDMIEDTSTALIPASERAALALQSSKTEQHLLALATKHTGITLVVDKAGREQAHGAAMELTRARTTVERTAKEARDDATKFNKAVIAEAARLIAIVEPEEIRLKAVRDAWDAEQARIKAEAEERERARVLAITGRIAEIKSFYALTTQCRTAERVKTLIDKLAAYDLSGFDEFDAEAAQAHADTMKAMGDHFSALAEREAEAARVKAEREELARQQAEAKRQADELAAKQKAEADRLAAERAEFARQQQEAAAALAAQQADVERQRAEFAAQQAEAERKVREAAEEMARQSEHAERQRAHAAQVEADRIAREQAEAASAARIRDEQARPPVDDVVDADWFAGAELADAANPAVTGIEFCTETPLAASLIQCIASQYGVDQATAARWLAARADEFKAIAS
jgi:hypothetical protein